MNDNRYEEITKAQVTKNRNVVISDCAKGGFTIAQQIIVKEGDMETPMFLKGAFHVDDIHGLYNFRDALNLAIKTIEDRTEDEDPDWD